MNTKDIGNITEAAVIALLVKRGERVLIPFGDNLRYDIGVDRDGELVRVQCKTGRLRDGVVSFRADSSQRHRGEGSQSYRGDADVFAVYCPDNENIYMVPVDEAGTARCCLRVAPSEISNKNIRWAEDYRVA